MRTSWKLWSLKCVSLSNASSPTVLTWTKWSSNTMLSYIVCLEGPHRQLIQMSRRHFITSVMTSWSHKISGQISRKLLQILSYWEPIWRHWWSHVTLWRHSRDITTFNMLFLRQFLAELDHLLYNHLLHSASIHTDSWSRWCDVSDDVMTLYNTGS